MAVNQAITKRGKKSIPVNQLLPRQQNSGEQSGGSGGGFSGTTVTIAVSPCILRQSHSLTFPDHLRYRCFHHILRGILLPAAKMENPREKPEIHPHSVPQKKMAGLVTEGEVQGCWQPRSLVHQHRVQWYRH